MGKLAGIILAMCALAYVAQGVQNTEPRYYLEGGSLYEGNYDLYNGHYVAADNGHYDVTFEAAPKVLWGLLWFDQSYTGQYDKQDGTYVYMGETGYKYTVHRALPAYCKRHVKEWV